MYIIGCYSKKIELLRTADVASGALAIQVIGILLARLGIDMNPYAVYTEAEWYRQPTNFS